MITKFVRRIFRILVARPWMSVMAIGTLGLSIGGNTAIYSLVDTLYFKYLPVPHADEIVGVYGMRGGNPSEMALPLRDYPYYREHTTAFSALAAHYSTGPFYIGTPDGESELALGAVVSGNYFSVLELRPYMGRFFTPQEGETNSQYPVAVISYKLWQNRFLGDAGILGKIIKINGVNFTIVGVAPKSFQGVFASFVDDVWMPLSMASVGYRVCNVQDRKCTFLSMFGRLAPGRTLQQGQSEMSALAQQINIAFTSNGNTTYKGISVSPLQGLRPTSRPAVANMVRLLVVAGMVLLLIAAANLSCLLLAQGIYRSKEMAVKLALGAKRAHIIGQLLGEAATLSILGAGVGLGLAVMANRALARFLFVGDDGRPTLSLDINSHVLIFTSAVVVGTMFLFALVPALINSHPHLTLVLKDQESIAGFHKSRLRQMLVAGQIGLSLVLLMSAVLLIKSLNHILDGPGFETTRIACLRVSPVRLAYTPEKSQAFLREVLRRVEAAPEVEHVSMGQSMPWWLPKPFEVALPGRTASREEDKVMASMNAVTPGYFQTMGIPLLQGRDFTAADVSNAGNVTVINESLANRLWPHQNPLGRVMVVANEQFTVIAVARDAQYRSIADKQQPFFYTSYWQEANGTDGRLYIRSKVIPEAVLQRIHKIIVGVDPDVPITEETSMTEGVRRSFDSVLLTRNVLSAAGTIALVLSMIGLYAVIAFAVAQRTREIGIRSALGAPRNNILYLILREGFGLALLGTVMGVSGTVGLVRLLSSLMYGVSAFDVITFTAVPLLVITLAALASYIPALNATRISPLIAIRHD